MAIKRTSEKLTVTGATAAVPARRVSTSIRTRKNVPATQAETVAQAPAVQAQQTEPTYEAIAALAYSYWEARGYQGGSAEEDWLRAEREILG
jgi:hypothetical protein